MAASAAANVARFGLSSTRARCHRVGRGRISRAARGYAAADEASTADEALLSETSRARGWDERELGALRRHYAREGWVVVRRLVTHDVVDALHAATDALEAEAAAFTRSRRERGVYFEVQSASGRKGDQAVAPGMLRKITSPSKRSKAFASLTTDANVRAVCAQLCGVSDGARRRGTAAARSPTGPAGPTGPMGDRSSSMRCVVDQVNLKHPAGAGTGFPWHQDVSFLKPDARAACDAHGGCNAVVAMDPSHEGNGGFVVLGGTHRFGEKFSQTRDAYDGAADVSGNVFDLSRRFCPRLEPGDAIFFHPTLAHGSGTNHSPERRRIATLWFVGAGE